VIAAALRAVFATLGRAVPKNAALPAAPAPTLKSLLTPASPCFPQSDAADPDATD